MGAENRTALLTLEIRDQQALAGLAKLRAGLRSRTGLLNTLGETLVESTKQRIRDGGPAPDGTPWKPLQPLTLELKQNKDRGILWDSGMLKDTLAFDLEGDEAVAIGSMMIYARIHQEGGTIKPKAGRKALNVPGRGLRRSVNIPARPYLGMSSADKAVLERKVIAWLKSIA
ncbi:MAG: phage virion morphogenesis protein [Acidobacteria bacterium]|nr:phage virion morphogenesis protein [Acidobacteriota bacterium]